MRDTADTITAPATTMTGANAGPRGDAEGYFHAIAAAIDRALGPGERYCASFAAESTDFVRMNRGKVRQPGHVEQRYLDVRLVRGARHATHALTLTGDLAQDEAAIRAALDALRGVLPDLADDPHLLLPDTVTSSRSVGDATLPAAASMVETILRAAAGEDLVGLLAAGPVQRGFANELGQRNWHETTTFNLQWSLYHRGDKAVKSSYAGFAFDATSLAARMNDARERLALVSRPAKTLVPGSYRAYLAPTAMEEIAGLLSYGAFSGRALATQQSALARMRSDATLDARVFIDEDTEGAVAPRFQSEGFARPPRVPLVVAGRLEGALVAPRTAREFDLAQNGANAWESPESLAMRGGDLPMQDALAALDTGLAIGNLWYLNYSDRPACRMTGMTRFATFWVEHGRIVAPVEALRFDDTLYRMLGENLLHLTRETELLLEPNTYGSRLLSSTSLPGAVLKDMAFTL
jgi:predicted Zn-dependent protease